MIENILGQGGMGRVYLAHDHKLDRQVALKVLSRERMNNPRALARFRREARVGAQLQHDNLVRIYDAGEEEGHLFLVMEFIEGKNVGKLIAERGPLQAPVAVRVARQVALGLEHARLKGLIHRDVNPMNILLDRDGTAKLTDLGLAIALEEHGEAVTRDGATVGTFDYISPEQARHSRSIDIRSDIYSLGCSLYQMLTGRVPFPQPSLPEKLYLHQMVDPEPLESLIAEVPAGLSAIVRKMMAKLPEDRYTTPLEVARALEPYQSGPLPLEEIESSPEVPILIEPGEPSTSDPDHADVSTATHVGRDRTTSYDGQGQEPPFSGSDTTREPAEPEPVGAMAIARAGTTSGGAGSPGPELFPIIDTGPDPLLSDKGTGARRARPQPLEDTTDGARRSIPSLGVIAGALGVLTLLGGIVWFQRRGSEPPGPGPENPPGAPATPSTDAGTGVVKPPSPGLHDVVVRWLDDGTEEQARDLGDAVNRAVNKNAAVILRNIEPLVLAPGLSIAVNGSLRIQAGEGIRPVLAIARGRTTPLFQINPSGLASLSGLTFRIDTADDTKVAKGLIAVHGELTLERCRLTIAGTNRTPAAVWTDGPYSTISSCHFSRVRQSGDCRSRRREPAPHRELPDRSRPSRRHATRTGLGDRGRSEPARSCNEAPRDRRRPLHCRRARPDGPGRLRRRGGRPGRGGRHRRSGWCPAEMVQFSALPDRSSLAGPGQCLRHRDPRALGRAGGGDAGRGGGGRPR